MISKVMFERFKKKEFAVHCPEEKESKEFIAYCHDNEVVWRDGGGKTCLERATHKRDTCYMSWGITPRLSYDNIDYYKGQDIDIVEFTDMLCKVNEELFNQFKHSKLAINPETYGEARDFIDYCYAHGVTWYKSLQSELHRKANDKDTTYGANNGSLGYASADYYRRKCNKKVITYKELLSSISVISNLYIPTENDYIFNGKEFVNSKGEIAY